MLHPVNNQEVLERFEKMADTIAHDYLTEVKNLLKTREEKVKAFSQKAKLSPSKKQNSDL